MKKCAHEHKQCDLLFVFTDICHIVTIIAVYSYAYNEFTLLFNKLKLSIAILGVYYNRSLETHCTDEYAQTLQFKL